jgi:hypothetical protein
MHTALNISQPKIQIRVKDSNNRVNWSPPVYKLRGRLPGASRKLTYYLNVQLKVVRVNQLGTCPRDTGTREGPQY